MSFNPVTHVLFDMDGLILNTEDLYTIAFQNITSRYGKEYTYDLKVKLMGSQSHETAETIITHLQLPLTPEEFMKETKSQFQSLFPNTQVLPGARRLIEHLHKKNIPIGLATSSSKESYDLKTGKHHQELFAMFPYKTLGTSDPEVKRGKPYPDIFLVAASKFPDKPSPSKCLVLEDSVNGVKAGLDAGMQVVMIPDPKLDRTLVPHNTILLDSAEEFRPEVFGLPPY
ncbi:unnamed protein product [Diatraea saccharalis]|uniref:pseudouridine 5'-phosphatase n=1 Tax=Diatraea saccharalis TaxID=40085 RepID=A0A9P0C8S9_9NEOP|nr:unnamed protein product [Diatraea saccharalis]